MTIIYRLAFLLALTLSLSLAGAQAQTPRMTTVNITPDSNKVHISAIGDVSEMRIEVSDESGDVVFQSGAITGQQLDWNMKDAHGERVAPGTYLVTVTFRNASGKLRKRVEQVMVAEDENSGQEAAKSAAPAAAQATVSTYGTPIVGRLTKFHSSSQITNSVITEGAGRIGIGTSSPSQLLHIKSASASANAAALVETLAGRFAHYQMKSGATLPWIVGTQDNFTDNALLFRNGSNDLMVIRPNGNVGIGTTIQLGKLSVNGTGTGAAVYGFNKASPGSGYISAAIHGFSTNMGVSGQSSGGTGIFGITDSGKGIWGQSTGSGFAGYFDGKVQINGTFTNNSDRHAKANIASINPRSILQRLVAVPIQAWNYKAEPATIRHIGPMAQDFHAAFGLGIDDKGISSVDADGVTMAAIQGMYQMMQEKDRKIEELTHQVNQQQTQLNQVKRTIKRQRTARR